MNWFIELCKGLFLKKFILSLLISTSANAIPIDLKEIKFYEDTLKWTKFFHPSDRMHYLYLYDVPKPYPNMFFGYMTPDESVETFIAHLKNNWDDDKSLEENWFDTVSVYNRRHHSLPMRIPNT